MKPWSGDSAPAASMSRSESSRDESVSVSSDSRSSGRSPVRSTSSPPWGAIRRVSVPTITPPPPSPAPRSRGRNHVFPPSPLLLECSLPRGSSRCHLHRHEAVLFQHLEDALRALRRLLVLRLDANLRIRRHLVGIRHTGELLDLPPEGLLVEAFHVTARALLDRRIDEDLDERAVPLDHL